MKHFVKLNNLFANAFTAYKVNNDRQPLNIISYKNPYKFKLVCDIKNHTFYSASSFTYKRAMELAEKFYEKMDKGDLYQCK